MECNYDGGDCCLDPIDTQYCSECQCIDGNATTENPVTTTVDLSGCSSPASVGDGYCDDATNIMECNYDGGDCCLDPVNTLVCLECQCLIDGGSSVNPGTTGSTTSPSGTLLNKKTKPTIKNHGKSC